MKNYNPERVVVVVDGIVVVAMLQATTAELRQVIFDFTCTTFLRTLN